MFSCSLSSFYQDNQYIGFCDNSEILPQSFDKFDTKDKLKRLFLYMSNFILEKSFVFSKYEQCYLSKFSLNQAFSYKINKELNNSLLVKQNKNRKFDFCKDSTLLINAYLSNSKIDIFAKTKNYKLNVAKLISRCYDGKSLSFMINKNLIFHEFVLNKVKKMHKDKQVFDLGDSIYIKSKDFYGIKIYTSWKDIKIDKPNIENELNNAIHSIKNGESYQIFLAYPKNDTFTKHIPVFVNELKNKEYQIKVVPYSLRKIIKNTKDL